MKTYIHQNFINECFYRTFILNNINLETAQVPISRIEKQRMVCSYNRTLLNNKNDAINDALNNMDDCPKHMLNERCQT